MKKITSFVLSLSLLGNLCYADDIIHLNQGDKAPNSGFLFSEDKTRDTRIKLLERNTFEGLNESLTKTNTFLQQNSEKKDEQFKLVMDRNIQLSAVVRDQQSLNNWEKAGYFVAGVLLTYFAIKTAHDIYK